MNQSVGRESELEVISRLRTQPGEATWRRPIIRGGGITLIEMLVVVALTVLLMSIIAEVFVLASETLSQLRSISDVNQKVRNVESLIRLDLENRTIREVQPPVERRAGFDGILGTGDDYFFPLGVDPAEHKGYWTLEESSPADENGEDTDDVLAFTVRVTAPLRGSGTLGTGFVGRVVAGSEPDVAYPEVGLAGSQEAEVIYFLRRGTLYRRVLLVGVPQPANIPAFNPNNASFPGGPTSWYSVYDISARPPLVAGDIPIVNTLGDLTYRSARYAHRVPVLYADDGPGGTNRTAWATYFPPLSGGLSADSLLDANFPFSPVSFVDSNTNSLHDAANPADHVDHNGNYPASVAQSAVELFWGRPRLRETSNRLWDYPNLNVSTATAFTNAPIFFDADEDRNFNGILDAGEDVNGNGILDLPTRVAEDAILLNVLSFDVKVWDPDAQPTGLTLATGAYVDLGKMWPGASGSVNTPGTTPSNGTLVGLPGRFPVFPFDPQGPVAGTWPPARTAGLPGSPLAPDHRGFGEPFGFNWPDPTNFPGWPASPPYAIPPAIGPDGQPGQAGTDDDGDGVTDNMSELGWAGTDDVPYIGYPPLGMLRAPFSMCRTYDTWCTSYTKPAQMSIPPIAPPYIVPVRGIQIKIRFADPQTRLTREITIVQELQ
jgi:type II secretory pathway pseudopilin PulG